MTRPDRVLLLCACLVLAGTVPARGEPPVGEAKPKVAAPGKGVRTDAYGDPLPQGAVARLGTVRFRHLKTIWALAYSPDGKMLAAADGDGVDSHRGLSWHGPAQGTIRLWDPATGKEIRRLTGHRGPIRRLAFSADGRLLMSLCEDVRLWDPATGKERELARVEGAVRCATLSSDGTMLAVGLEGQVRLLDVASGKEVRQFRFSGDFIQAVALSPDGKTMAAACKNSAHLCDVATGRELRKFSDASPGPKLAFSPDGKLLATAEYYRPVRLWDAGTCKQLHTLGRDGEGGNFFAFSPDSKALLAGPVDDTTLWDVATGKEIRRFGGKRGFQFAGAFAPDGKTLALSDDHAVRQFEVATGKELLPRTAHASDLDVPGLFARRQDDTHRCRWTTGVGPGHRKRTDALRLTRDGGCSRLHARWENHRRGLPPGAGDPPPGGGHRQGTKPLRWPARRSGLHRLARRQQVGRLHEWASHRSCREPMGKQV